MQTLVHRTRRFFPSGGRIAITSTHYAYLRLFGKGGQAELAWVVWFNTKTVYSRTGSSDTSQY